MKLLVFSDSHGDVSGMIRAVEEERPDQILHLGDCVPDTKSLERFSIPILNVAGNCDRRGAAPEILAPEFSHVKLYMTHGHLHEVKTSYEYAVSAALAENADILLFGHTHRAECFPDRGIFVLNPGACSGRPGSYGRILLEQGGIRCSLQSV